MAKPQVKTIQTLDRKPNSLAGNPRWTVYFTDGTKAETKPDASCNYDLQNPEFHAPNMVQVYFERGKIAEIELVKA